MVETLTNIKNNKVKNLPGGQGQVASETTTKMKKFLGGLSRKRQGKRFDLYFVDLRLILIIALLRFYTVVMAHEPLRVTLNDILTASTKGKWWIVGAAWAGDPVRERERERARQAALKQASEGKQAGSKREADENGDDETDLIGLGIGQQDELLRLARKQGMNTDVRRQVFMVMMTSDVSLFTTTPSSFKTDAHPFIP
jgi:nucleolar MIF4G domain-containing protein 1